MGRKAGGHNKPKDAASNIIEGQPKAQIEISKQVDTFRCGACHKTVPEKYPVCPYCGQALTWQS